MQQIAPLTKLVEQLRRLPGIGPKSAVRLAYHVLAMDKKQVGDLAAAIIEAKEKISYCSVCFNLTDCVPCQVCQSKQRDASIICVVEEPQDSGGYGANRVNIGVCIMCCTVHFRRLTAWVPKNCG